MLVLQVDKTVRPNLKYILQIEYNGDIQQMPYGLFKISTNMTETGEIKYVSFILAYTCVHTLYSTAAT